MTGIALSQLGHEVAVEHGLSHLHLLVAALHVVLPTVVTARAETAHASLIEYLILITLSVNVGKHIMDT